MPHFICTTCGTQFAPTPAPPDRCPICEDERQYVGPSGQQWLTLDDYRRTHRNVITEAEPGLHVIHPQPKAGIGQRAFLVRTPAGNLLWDCVPLIDATTVAEVNRLGGLTAIAVSHPHYYTTMVEWSRAFGGVPVYIHEADRDWVMRADPAVTPWSGTSKELFGGLTLVHTGGHFAGFQVVHWAGGADRRGVLLCGDQPFVCADRRWVSFMFSYPNLIPLGAAAVRRVADRLGAVAFDRLYGAFPEQVVTADANAAVRRSAARYLASIGG